MRLEEDFVLQLPFLLPEDNYSCDIVRGVPGGLLEFLQPLQAAGLCIMTPQPTSSGHWTIYMDTPPPLTPLPRYVGVHPSEIMHSGRGKFMPLPLSKILETPGSLVTDYINMSPLWIRTFNLQASLMVQYELSGTCNFSATCPQSEQT